MILSPATQYNQRTQQSRTQIASRKHTTLARNHRIPSHDFSPGGHARRPSLKGGGQRNSSPGYSPANRKISPSWRSPVNQIAYQTGHAIPKAQATTVFHKQYSRSRPESPLCKLGIAALERRNSSYWSFSGRQTSYKRDSFGNHERSLPDGFETQQPYPAAAAAQQPAAAYATTVSNEFYLGSPRYSHFALPLSWRPGTPTKLRRPNTSAIGSRNTSSPFSTPLRQAQRLVDRFPKR